MGYLGLFPLSIVDGGHLSRRAVLLESDGRVKDGQNTLACNKGGIAAASVGIGDVLGQHIELDVVECRLHTHIAQYLVEITVVISCLLKALSCHKILVGIDMAGTSF